MPLQKQLFFLNFVWLQPQTSMGFILFFCDGETNSSFTLVCMGSGLTELFYVRFYHLFLTYRSAKRPLIFQSFDS